MYRGVADGAAAPGDLGPGLAQHESLTGHVRRLDDTLLAYSASCFAAEDEAAVNVLQSSKLLADDISQKQKTSDETEQKIDQAREGVHAGSNTLLPLSVASVSSACISVRIVSLHAASSPNPASLWQ